MKKQVLAAALSAALMFTLPFSASALTPPALPLPVLEQMNAAAFEPLGIKKKGFYLMRRGSSIYVFYAIELENTNPTLAVEFPHIQTTLTTADGSVVKSEDQVLSCIAAGDTYWYADYFSFEFDGAVPSRIDFYVWADDENYTAPTGNGVVRSEALVVTEPARHGTSSDVYYTGKITNNSACATDVRISVIYQKKDANGNEGPVGGDYTFVEALQPGETRAFELHPYSQIDSYTSAVFTAIPW